jgi:hypothetical protein
MVGMVYSIFFLNYEKQITTNFGANWVNFNCNSKGMTTAFHLKQLILKYLQNYSKYSAIFSKCPKLWFFLNFSFIKFYFNLNI